MIVKGNDALKLHKTSIAKTVSFLGKCIKYILSILFVHVSVGIRYYHNTFYLYTHCIWNYLGADDWE